MGSQKSFLGRKKSAWLISMPSEDCWDGVADMVPLCQQDQDRIRSTRSEDHVGLQHLAEVGRAKIRGSQTFACVMCYFRVDEVFLSEGIVRALNRKLRVRTTSRIREAEGSSDLPHQLQVPRG